ncbi:MAG TPA: ComEC/Rec2 family competence protein, partial [Candidatus Limnocylindrales bacterium]|nr:ComEC/Rec2 family competence protein [Candidatus Limnocylindrales bacterium]
MTASGWLAIGAALGALAAPAVGALVVGMAAAGLALALAAAPRSRSPRVATGSPWARIRFLLPVALGSLALGLRILLGGAGAASAPPLPDGHGPWIATVESRGSNREGQQVATVRIGGPGRTSWLVAATLPRYPEIEPGDIVTIDGGIEAPPAGPYGAYLDRIGVTGTIRARELVVAGRAAGPGAMLERLRRSSADALAAAIPEPEAGLAAGIVIGLRDRVDRALAADFTTVGASHIVAISGWNIAIVAATVAALAGRLGRRRRTLVLVPAILLYVVFAGASPSVVRAAAMAGVVLLARETGRAGRAAAALG